jgi:tRNA(Ile)-lysidine synthase
MTRAGASVRELRSAPAARTILRDWRRLGEEAGIAPRRAGDSRRKTLIACSGGADSSGLAIALAAGVSSPGDALVLAHIVHDFRPEADALADRDSVRDLAERLGLPFAESSIHVRHGAGNAEARARHARYVALRRLAQVYRCPAIATAHHAHDQLETILMALVRGAAARGLSGVRPWRTLGGVLLMRPALAVERAGLQDLCRRFGHAWREDATNADLSRLRARIRHTVVPLLTGLRPGVAARAAHTAELLGGAAAIVGAAAAELRAMAAAADPGEGVWLDRALLATAPPVLIGAVLRECLSELGHPGLDAAGSGAIRPLVRAVRDGRTDPRIYRVGPVGITLTARRVRLEAHGHGRPAHPAPSHKERHDA